MSNTTITAPLETVLRDCSGAITYHTGLIEERIAALHAEVLPTQLKIGLYCLKAHVAFALQAPGKRGQGRKPNNQVHVDVISPQGFEGWLLTNHPTIKKPTAYRWMTALKGLGLSESDTEKQVDAALAKLENPTLKSLCDASLELIAPPAREPHKLQQSEFEFLRDGLAAYREESDHILAIKPQLDQHPEMLRAATARAYQVLRELTGTDWQPSDTPDDLANVDPDAISL